MGLYGDVVLERFRHPRYFGELTAPDASHEDVNPLCGDRLRVEVRIGSGAGTLLEAVRFHGDACAIAVASADLLAEMAEGQTPRSAGRIEREEVLRALGTTIRSSRLGCVTLPLTVLRGALAALSGPGALS
jgi:nitrogen fixation NifU-like protein